MRRIKLISLILLLGALSATQVAAEYRVILRDGSWLRAQSKPMVKDGQVRIRLLDGLLTAVPESRIDWQASERWNRKRPDAVEVPEGVLPTPTKPVPAAVRMVRDPSAPVATPADPAGAAEAPAEVQPPPPDPTPPAVQPGEQLRERIGRLDHDISRLRERKVDLDARARSAIHLDDAAKLRTEAEGVQRQIQALRAEQSRLILQLPGRKP